MLKNRSRRSGMTLPEVLVTVAIVAVLAAIVVPTVTNQIGKGDDTNFATNVSSLSTAVTAFVTDVRKFPRVVSQLYNKPAATDVDITGAAFGAGAVARWRGPYQAGSRSTNDSTLIGLAYLTDTLADTAFGGPTTGYLGVKLGGVTSQAAALHLDSIIDGGTGPAAGSLRWAGSPPTGGRVTLLLMGR